MPHANTVMHAGFNYQTNGPRWSLQGRRKVCKGGEAESCYVVALPRDAREMFRVLVSQASKFEFIVQIAQKSGAAQAAPCRPASYGLALVAAQQKKYGLIKSSVIKYLIYAYYRSCSLNLHTIGYRQ